VRPLAALAVLAALVVAGCASDPDESGKASAAEGEQAKSGNFKGDVAWLVLLRRWRIDIGRQAEGTTRIARDVQDDMAEPDDLSGSVKPLTECSERLREQVGEPKTSRYARSYDLFLEACDAVSDWAQALDDSSGRETKDVKARNTKVDDRFENAETVLGTTMLARKGLPTIGGKVTRSRIEPRFGRALNRLEYQSATASQIEVRCWSEAEWPAVKLEWAAYIGTEGDIEGFAYDDYRVSIAPDFCAALVRLVYDRERPTKGAALVETANAVGVLAHEMGHIAVDPVNEARTQCYGIQQVRMLTRILGAGAEYGALLAKVNWELIYPRMPADYRTAECRNGGPLDLNPASDVWP
jgi:hypothetical protein